MKTIYYVSTLQQGAQLDKIKETLKQEIKPNGLIVFIRSSQSVYPKAAVLEQKIIDKCQQFGIGFTDVKVIDYLTDIQQYSDWISQASLIYLHGGNPLTFYELLKQYDLIEALKGYQGVLIGASAGAMVLSDSIVIAPINEEYPCPVIEPGLGLSPLSIYPHLNAQDVFDQAYQDDEGVTLTEDLRTLSEQGGIDCLSDNQIIRVHHETIDYIGEFFYRFKDRKLQKRVNQDWVECFTIPDWFKKPQDCIEIQRSYPTMQTALRQGFISTLFHMDPVTQCHTWISPLCKTEEKGRVYQQCESETLKTWVVIHPQFIYATLVIKQQGNQVIETLTFRTRYLKVFEMMKVLPVLRGL